MEMDQVLQTFLQESTELLQVMEDTLLQMEGGPVEEEAINAVFRAAHTIKGSAGLFGFDDVVKFTHVVESVLDRVRDGELALGNDLVALLLKSRDHIDRLVQLEASDTEADDETRQQGDALVAKLTTWLGETVQEKPRSDVPAKRKDPVESSGGGVVSNDAWHISLRFGHDVLRNGMDPLSFVRYLGTLGDIVNVVTLYDAMPVAAEMDPESCYLGFEINLRSDADKAAIEGVFEFVRDDCLLRILPPHGRIADFIQLLSDLPGDEERVGELLVKSGAITRSELEEGLRKQEAAAAAEGKARLGEILVEQGAVQRELVDAALDKQRLARDSKAQESKFIRVQADKLDQLINLVGELVISSDGVHLHAQRLNDEGLYESASLIGRLVSEIRDGALLLRMVQIGETFNRFHRVVRDVSRELGKDIGLSVSGAETELDKSVVEKIGDPLMHLVRNAMDHGIESAELRQSRGKPAKGTLSLNAYHESGSVVIEVSDDGGGLNRTKVLAKARERGLVGADQELSEREICNLIFEAGFSTADAVTNLSGRGVGMDVVRRNIEALRGTVEMESLEGRGTTARIRLPLTLAIIDAFLMGVGNGAYVVPLDAVVECVELDEQMRRDSRGNDYINLRDEILPFLRLREVFDIRGDRPELEYVVVVQFGNSRAGLVVDELLGEFQAVIKPVAKIFGSLPGIGGTTILGSGEVALLLDVTALVQQAIGRDTRIEARETGRQALPA